MAISIRHLASVAVCLQCLRVPAQGGRLLVVPVDGSHWLSMRILVQELHARGHHIVVVFPENNLVIHRAPEYSSKTFRTAYSKQHVRDIYRSLIRFPFINGTFFERFSENLRLIQKFSDFFLITCEGLLRDSELLRELAEGEFDALFTDPFSPCGSIVAAHLSLPSVFLLRGVPCGLDYEAAQCPRPLSYVPRHFTGNADRMSFSQRVHNVLGLVMESVVCHVTYSRFDELAARFLQKEVTVKELLSRGAIWLLRFDFVFEYPRPLMPNMILVGGMNCKDRKPLPEELEEFMNSSGEYGAVIFSLGSMVSDVPIETADQIAEALGQIPQKVLWRHTGVKPSTLAPNTKLMKWMPQNDLLSNKTIDIQKHVHLSPMEECMGSMRPSVLVYQWYWSHCLLTNWKMYYE
ncbi:UDP-glucuronosyltransferase 1A1 isoform X4 [Callorhinchus milii]|uniref:UDP-glucuronosyltransferase 1A1 isoform X4 n=1 Tax=Callorhinchus milii TaxID=7868 RepID=UPI001C3FB5C8|nr:UDP-glucuronosyltransferase 1A1 isoform X4 [Callorhinchus milii]